MNQQLENKYKELGFVDEYGNLKTKGNTKVLGDRLYNMSAREANNMFKESISKNIDKLDDKQRKAVEKLFEVKVLNVNTMTVKGKTKRVRYKEGKTSDWKKAIVTIDTNPGEQTYLGKGGKVVKVSKKYKDSIEEFAGV